MRRSWSFLVLIAGCGAPLPGTLVGESAHFRLFIDPDLDPTRLAASQQGQPALDALEIDWADKLTMLQMPEGKKKIDYHLATGHHIAEVCQMEFDGNETAAACELPGTLQIAAGYLPHQHELMHAYMELVAPGAVPIPFLVEGTAEAIGCNTTAGSNSTYDDVPWQQAVVATARDTPTAVYAQGGLFARHLIRTQGIDTFIRYYRQAPGRRDPALFAANFSAFWNMTVDDAWTAMYVVQPGAAATIDDPICPCSLAPLPTDGQPIPFDVARPYWTIGDTQGASIGVTAPGGGLIIVRDCEGVTPALSTFDLGFPRNTPKIADTHVGIIHLADGRSHYIPANVSSALLGDYLANDCAGTTPYALPADFLSGSGGVWVLCSPALGEDLGEYLQLQVPFAAHVAPSRGFGICDSCDFTPGSCPLVSSLGVSSTVVPGPLNVALPPSQMRQELAAAFGATILRFTK